MAEHTLKREISGGGSPERPDLPKQYKPSDHEERIRELWERSGAFHADPEAVLAKGRPPYAIVIPPPNVTDRLHLGHALNNTLQDVLARAHRMMGYETLWMPGTDHAGIATQTVVERRMMKEEGKRRTDFSREEFIARVQAFKDEYEATITGQLRAMGCSCDWERQRFTMDEVCARAVNEAFFRLFRDGLIYRGKRLVNWDPVTQTALADDEVEMEEVDGKFYYLRYPLVHAVVRGSDPGAGQSEEARDEDERDSGQSLVPVTWSDLRARGYPMPVDAAHEDETQAWLTVATTRPETYLGDTAVAINPRDPRAKALRGILAELPLVGRVIPIVEDDYVVLPRKIAEALGDEDAAADPKSEFATGFLKVTPGHDPNDYEIGRRHDLPIINVMAPDATISDKHGWGDVGDGHVFVGKSREAARELVVKEFQARGLLGDIKPYRHSVGHSYRSHAAIEPYMSDQWYVRVTDPRLRDAALRALAEDQRTGGTRDGGATFQVAWPPATEAGLESDPSNDEDGPWQRATMDLSTTKRRLPHWQRGGRTYFVTFRVAHGTLTEEERQIVLDACTYWHGTRAQVQLVVVMPDHVHMLLRPLERSSGDWWPLGQIMQSIKGFSAREIGRRRGSEGGIWQHEGFDRIVRDADEFDEKWNYMLRNPVKAGLVQKAGEYRFIARSDFGSIVQQGTAEYARVVSDPEARGPKWGNLGGDNGEDSTSSHGQPERLPHRGDGGLRFFPERYARTFENWHVNIRDWCISRQLWWGHRIPVWSLRILDLRDNHEPLDSRQWIKMRLKSLTEEEQRLVATQVEPGPDGLLLHVCVAPRNTGLSQKLEAAGFARDPDVLDTWFSSALWPMSTMGWPDETSLLKSFNPTSVLCTAREIITLWVSRMVMFNRYFRGQDLGLGEGNGPLPFRDVFIHAMIQDGEGRKMSKSLRNGVDPLDIIHSHGADAMRFVLCQMTTQTQDVRMPVAPDPVTGRNTSPKFDIGRNFCNKLWNASRFAMGILQTGGNGGQNTIRARELSTVDRWMLSRLLKGAKAINMAIEEYQYSDYAQLMYDLMWRDFCDWYLEAIKPTVSKDAGQRAVLDHALETIVRFLHPIAPFITETIWERLREVESLAVEGITLGDSRKGGVLATAGWPVLDGILLDEKAELAFERVRSLVTAVREVRAQHNVPPKRRVKLHVPAHLHETLGNDAALVMTLAGVDQVLKESPTGPAAAFTFEAAECHVSEMADAVDADAERVRIEKRLEELRKQSGILEGRLNNPGYAERAPAKMVQETRDQLAQCQAEIASLNELLRKNG